jgi:hypothetical protein
MLEYVEGPPSGDPDACRGGDFGLHMDGHIPNGAGWEGPNCKSAEIAFELCLAEN